MLFNDFLKYEALNTKEKVGFNKNQIKTIVFLKDRVTVILNYIGKVDFPLDTQYTLKTVEIRDCVEATTKTGALMKFKPNEIQGYQIKNDGSVNIVLKYIGIANIPFKVIEHLFK